MPPLHPNLIKLNASMIPRFTHHTTLEREGFVKLSDIVRNKKYIDDDAGTPRSYYLAANPDAAAQRSAISATALLAKELRLSGQEVCYVSTANFMRELSMGLLPREVHTLNPVLSHIGKGYIVIPEFNTLDYLATIYPLREVMEFEAILLHHWDQGGAFVFCGKPRREEDVTEFGQSFAAAYDRHVTTIRIGVSNERRA